ncbi:PREDICTED: probable ATP-dependent RNA helicase DHX35 [Drosophila arizonae]|uniref:RNA helicase n=1 Tax=Drosophila arizonae TaxID=7263 RepID=A0ABM1NZ85_DROAR|nr:PREDICTED: probable ATP-dependent RNA helicase DHX35 [Drosophila arizonae]XP_017860272.1 PREDICTED: probable ATP-dependent RNA helicase DHX35 [Drosophila arizonae]XP_017860273.1 PREDICTED: probable ATP-dependent RNA helicase DHX35 [Drosophila arizonae]
MATFKPKFIRPETDDVIDEGGGGYQEPQNSAFVFNANHNLGLVEQRERLPIRKYRDQILYCLENHQVVILVGETGSGKSTQVPQYLYEWGWHSKGMIGVTEPRRVSAVTLANRVAQERGELVGDTVGYVVRFLERTSQDTHIKYMTEGILLRELLADPLLTQYGVIIVDEAHERNMLTDMVLGLLKKILRKRSNLKLIISSATIDASFFSEFFSWPRSGAEAEQPINVKLSIEGRMHAVSHFYLNEPCADYVRETVETVWKLHQKEPPGDILAFLTGQEEVLEAMDLLREYIASQETTNLKVLPMYGSMTSNDQLAVFFTPPKGVRKVVLATNIAETSITIPGIVYVIDCGYVKVKWYNPTTCSDSLVVVPVSKASAIQRAGRAGRVRPGKVYRLYTKEDYDALAPRQPPEMRRSEMSGAVLQLKALGIGNVLRFDFPSPPPAKNLLSALETLYALDAIDEQGQLTRPVGFLLAELPFSAMLSKMLYISGQMGCSEEIITIIAMLQVQSVFSRPASAAAQQSGRIAHRHFEVAEGDLITLLNVHSAFVEEGMTKEFCGQYYLIYRNLKRACELREQLLNLARNKYGIAIFSCKGDVEIVCKCITAGFFTQVAYLHHSGVYRQISSGTELAIHPNSTLYTLPQAQYVVYCELLQTTKLFMNHVTVIKKEWLTELAPHYYQQTTVRD